MGKLRDWLHGDGDRPRWSMLQYAVAACAEDLQDELQDEWNDWASDKFTGVAVLYRAPTLAGALKCERHNRRRRAIMAPRSLHASGAPLNAPWARSHIAAPRQKVIPSPDPRLHPMAAAVRSPAQGKNV